MALSKKGSLQEIPIDKIVINRNVRININWDWVKQLAKYYLDKKEINPITVSPLENGTYQLVKGRHRLKGRELADFKTIMAYVKPQDNDVDLIIEAISDDVEGNIPLTDADYVYVAKQLLELTGSKRQAVIKLSAAIHSNKMANEYVSIAVSSKERRQTSKAMDALASDENMTMKKAAEEYGVDIEKLRAKVRGKKRSAQSKGVSLRDLTGNISTSHKAFTRVYQKTFNQMQEAYDANLADVSDFEKFFDSAENLANVFLKRVQTERERFKVSSKV